MFGRQNRVVVFGVENAQSGEQYIAILELAGSHVQVWVAAVVVIVIEPVVHIPIEVNCVPSVPIFAFPDTSNFEVGVVTPIPIFPHVP